jgi:hypothetical protein
MTDFVEIMDELPFPESGQTTLSSGSVIHTPNDPNPTVNLLNVKSVSVQQSPSFPSVPAQLIATDAMTEVRAYLVCGVIFLTDFAKALVLNIYSNSILQINSISIQAYRQEALFFRTKASELELIVREHILRSELAVSDAVQTLGPAELPQNETGSTDALGGSGSESQKRMLTHSMSLMSVTGNYENTLAGLKPQQSVAGECQSQICAERIRQLMEENESVLEKVCMWCFYVRFPCVSPNFLFKVVVYSTKYMELADKQTSEIQGCCRSIYMERSQRYHQINKTRVILLLRLV